MRKRIISGIVALTIGLSMALPIRASADWDDHPHWRHHHAWRWERQHDYYRAYPYAAPPAYSYAPGYAYPSRPYRGYRYIPENGEGMVNPRHPGLYWACDSDGHHCHWARRW
jgi:hypothetical protein